MTVCVQDVRLLASQVAVFRIKEEDVYSEKALAACRVHLLADVVHDFSCRGATRVDVYSGTGKGKVVLPKDE